MQENDINKKVITQLVNKADRLLRKYEYSAAIEVAKQVLVYEPLNNAMHYLLVYCYAFTYQIKKAESHLQSAKDLNANSYYIAIAEAMILTFRKKFKAAEIILLKLKTSKMANYFVYLNLIWLYRHQYLCYRLSIYRLFGQRIKILRKLEATFAEAENVFASKFAANILNLRIFIEFKQVRKGHKLAERCIGMRPNHPYAFVAKSYFYMIRLRGRKARQWLSQAMQIDPNSQFALSVLVHLNTGYIKHQVLRLIIRCFSILLVIASPANPGLIYIAAILLYLNRLGYRKGLKAQEKQLRSISLSSDF